LIESSLQAKLFIGSQLQVFICSSAVTSHCQSMGTHFELDDVD